MKPKERVGFFYSEEWSAPSLESRESWCLLCMQMTGISQVLLNRPVQLGWWSWEHLVCSASCQADVPIQMFSPKCLFPPHTPSKQPANALAFQEKKIKVFFMLGKSVQEEQFQLCWLCALWTCSEQVVLSLHPPLWLPGNWGGLNSFKMFKLGRGRRKADTTAQIWLWAQNNKLSKV